MDDQIINHRLKAHDSQAEIVKKNEEEDQLEEHKKEIMILKENISNLQEQCKIVEKNKTMPGKRDEPLEGMIGTNSRQNESAIKGRSNIEFNEEPFCSSTEVQLHDVGLREIGSKIPADFGRFNLRITY